MKREIIKTDKELQSWLQVAPEVVAFDTETNGLDWLTLQCVGFSLCDGNRACYAACSLQPFQEWLPGKTIICHNVVFDMKVLKKYGTKEGFTPICTLTGAKLIDENLNKGEYSLKHLAHAWLNIPGDEIKSFEEVAHLPPDDPKFMEYAINDAIWAWKLWKLEEQELEKQMLLYLFYNVEMPFTFCLRDLETEGILVDTEELEKLKVKVGVELNNTRAKMLSTLGLQACYQKSFFSIDEVVSPINFNSNSHLVSIIEKLGFAIKEKTKPSKTFPQGQKSVGKKTLQRLKGKHEFIDLLIEYRKLEKMYSAFVEPCLEYIQADGRIRPSYTMVRTGRLSCSNPNCQQLPKKK